MIASKQFAPFLRPVQVCWELLSESFVVVELQVCWENNVWECFVVVVVDLRCRFWFQLGNLQSSVIAYSEKIFIKIGQSINIAHLLVTRMITLLLVIYLEINELGVIDWTMSYLWDNLSTQWRQRANKRYSNSHSLPGVTLDNNYIQEYKLIWIFSLLTRKAFLTKIALIEEAAALMNRLVNQ